MRKPRGPWAAAICGTARPASVLAATGAWGTAWRTPSFPDWNWRSQWHDGRWLRRPVRPLPHGPLACGLAGGGPRKLAGCARLEWRAWGALAGAYRRRGHPALRGRGGWGDTR